METVRAVIRSRMHVMADYASKVTRPVWKEELRQAGRMRRRLLRRAKRALVLERSRMSAQLRQLLDDVLSDVTRVRTVYQYRMQLLDIWERTYGGHERRVQALHDWCQRAEQSGIEALREFAFRLRGYTLKPA